MFFPLSPSAIFPGLHEASEPALKPYRHQLMPSISNFSARRMYHDFPSMMNDLVVELLIEYARTSTILTECPILLCPSVLAPGSFAECVNHYRAALKSALGEIRDFSETRLECPTFQDRLLHLCVTLDEIKALHRRFRKSAARNLTFKADHRGRIILDMANRALDLRSHPDPLSLIDVLFQGEDEGEEHDQQA